MSEAAAFQPGPIACRGIRTAVGVGCHPGHDPPDYSGDTDNYAWCPRPDWQSDTRGYGFRPATLPAEDYANCVNIDKEE
jgi:hypothetical protein